jgi:hypothetical protein
MSDRRSPDLERARPSCRRDRADPERAARRPIGTSRTRVGCARRHCALAGDRLGVARDAFVTAPTGLATSPTGARSLRRPTQRARIRSHPSLGPATPHVSQRQPHRAAFRPSVQLTRYRPPPARSAERWTTPPGARIRRPATRTRPAAEQPRRPPERAQPARPATQRPPTSSQSVWPRTQSPAAPRNHPQADRNGSRPARDPLPADAHARRQCGIVSPAHELVVSERAIAGTPNA